MIIEDVRDVRRLCEKADDVHSNIRSAKYSFKNFEKELPKDKNLNQEKLEKIFDEVYDAILYLEEALDDLTSYAISEYVKK